ncbi:MAG: transcriptional regulator [Clostridiales bacterium GWF2_36_10]|nr:MAG: transcriptional regulator [Clostridiales bacterium GWF2_36_10]HAN20446.1 transcriptional regulator [Clostridiales bacterium]
MINIYMEKAMIFKAFCDENRLKILAMLQDGEKCACKILEKMEIGQSTLSHHMKILVDSGVVEARNEGKWTHYSLSKTGTQYARQVLDEITRIKPEVCCKCK